MMLILSFHLKPQQIPILLIGKSYYQYIYMLFFIVVIFKIRRSIFFFFCDILIKIIKV